MSYNDAWIGVDLDGTLAHYEKFIHASHIGEPIALMVERVIAWRRSGKTVKIFTARISHDGSPERVKEAIVARVAIEDWCKRHLGEVLPVTNVKDYAMVELYDDRCVQVEKNTGRLIGRSSR